MNKYPFDQSGVSQWLQQLYSSTVELQMLEQELILHSLWNWLMSRFDLSEDQLEYVASLAPDFKSNLAQEIAFAINNHAEITLDKQTSAEASSTLSHDSVKVTEYESNKIQSATPDIPADSEANTILSRCCEDYLIVRIYYKLL